MGSCPSVCRVCMLVFAILGLFHLPSTLLKRDWKKLKSGPDDVDIIHGPWTSVSPAVFCAAALDRPGCFCHRRAWKYETARLGWHGSIFRDGHVSFATDETVSVLLDLTVVLLVGGCSNRRTEVQDAIWLWPLWIVWEVATNNGDMNPITNWCAVEPTMLVKPHDSTPRTGMKWH